MAGLRIIRRIAVSLVFLSLTCAQVTGLSNWDIWIDAGHSQDENMGIYGYSEARKNLRVALNLEDLLLTLTDIDTVGMTRRNDQVQVGLSERCYMANNWGASWFHSLHSDAGGSSANSTLLLWGQLANGNPDPPVGGEAMSDIMIDLLTRGMRTYTIVGSIGDCSFYGCSGSGPYLAINRLTNMPSELSEAGFHTNPRQNQLNMNAEWKRLEAWTFFWSVLKYHDIPRPFVGIAAGIISNLDTGVPINGATVTLNGQTYTTDSHTSLFYQYSSDPDLLHNGFYYFENLPDSSLELIVTADDFYPDTMMITVRDTFFTFNDFELLSSRSPYILSTIPVEGDTAYPTIDDIIINFSREVDPISVEAAFSITPFSAGTFHWTNGYQRLIFTPDLLDYETDYEVVIADGAHDSYGHLLDGDNDGQPGGDFILHFRSSAMDIYPPEIVSIYPPASANNVELHPIVSISYNEIVGPDTVIDANIRLERHADHTDVDLNREYYIIDNRTVINLFPVELLHSDEVYVTRVTPGLTDQAGNVTQSYGSYSFSTSSTGLNITYIDPFEQDITANWKPADYSGSNAGNVPDSIARLVNTDIVNHLTGSTKSLEIKYGWEVSASNWLLREYLAGGPPRNVHFNSNYIMQVYVFGDGSGNQFRFAVDDNNLTGNASDHEVSPWYTVDWYGWKLISWDMTNDGTGVWLGDGNLDGTMRFDSIQLTYTPGSPAFGSFIFDDLRVVQPEVVGVDDVSNTQPIVFRLKQNYPNPFNPETAIEFTIIESGPVSLKIYDLSGRLVCTLVDSRHDRGTYHVTWDGRSSNGQPLASGVYIYRLTGDGHSISRQMVLMK
ncbi:MAG: Ig-like domain-containing protein [Candidatus Marinimicrobia bacterium]|nr:Ig-like domain-containing protein [Candidatus Neomarinimicrobiota bacterium]